MLKRVLTAVVLIPLVVLGILRLPTPYFAAAAGLFLILAAWEWCALIPLRTRAARVVYLLLLVALALAAWTLFDREPLLFNWLLSLALVWWLFAAAWLLSPQTGRDWRAFKFALAALVLLPAWLALVLLHGMGGQGPQLALFVFALMWVADSAAYFAGRSLGRRKLAPRVSPGKTWEGAAGGLIGGALFALAAGAWLGWGGGRLAGFVALSAACVGLSIVGDLFISLLKRQQGLKDTGTLFPGHGGVLDRIDSLLAAAPLFAYGMSMGLGAGLGWLEG